MYLLYLTIIKFIYLNYMLIFMSEWVLYQGRSLGRVKAQDFTFKPIFVAENLESLAELFRLKDEDEIETEGQGKMMYKLFKEKYLSRISEFYPNFNSWVLKNTKSKTILVRGF